MCEVPGPETAYTRGVNAARTLILAVLALATALATGCRPSVEPRFDAVPGPVRTVDIAIAAAEEPQPLTPDEWAAVDAVHDRYLVDFDRLRTEVLAPLVQAVRADRTQAWMKDGAALARLARRHAAAIDRVRALDDALAADLEQPLRAHPGMAQRIADRRAVARSVRIVEGLGDGRAESPTILDLEPLVRELRLDAAARAAAEPALVAYRRDLAGAARAVADAMVDQPRAWLVAIEAGGVGAERVEELRQHVNEGDEQRAAFEAAQAAYQQSEREGRRDLMAALERLDDVNRRGLERIRAALPADAAAQLEAADARRRSTDDGPTADYAHFVVDIYRAHPTVRAGRAPGLAAALDRLDAAIGAWNAAQAEEDRRRLHEEAQARPGGAAPRQKEIEALQQRFVKASERVVEQVNQELGGELVEELKATNARTPDEMQATLAAVIGDAAADRAMRRASRALFRNPAARQDAEWDGNRSIAEQLLLAHGMDRQAFRLAARGLGARDDDPLVEQLWDRHAARVADLEARQRGDFKALEARAEKEAGNAARDPQGFERTLNAYLDALIAADAERLAAEDETFREIAIAVGTQDGDARFALVRAAAAARRAALPWRRFEQPWLLGALWQADADPIADALAIEGDDSARQAALLVLAAHADALRDTADAARRAGLEALRDLLLMGLRMQREGRAPVDPSALRDAPEARAIAQRVETAGHARRAAGRRAVEAVAAVLPPDRGDNLLERWARTTFPEFWADGTAWRTAADAVRAGAPSNAGDTARATIAAAIDHWRIVDEDMTRRVAAWADERTAVPAPATPADVATTAAADPALGALRTLRDENAWRLLRTIACALGQPADARMPGEDGRGSPPRAVRWSR